MIAAPDDFAQVYAIINRDLFWCQKPAETNLWMTLRLVFYHFFDKIHSNVVSDRNFLKFTNFEKFRLSNYKLEWLEPLDFLN